MPITAVVSTRRGSTDPSPNTWVTPHVTHRARRGRRISVVDPWSQTRRVRPYPQDRSIPPHPGHVSSPATKSASARARSTIPIIGSSSQPQRTSVASHEQGWQGPNANPPLSTPT